EVRRLRVAHREESCLEPERALDTVDIQEKPPRHVRSSRINRKVRRGEFQRLPELEVSREGPLPGRFAQRRGQLLELLAGRESQVDCDGRSRPRLARLESDRQRALSPGVALRSIERLWSLEETVQIVLRVGDSDLGRLFVEDPAIVAVLEKPEPELKQPRGP